MLRMPSPESPQEPAAGRFRKAQAGNAWNVPAA